jgi:hypothetical protein
MAERNRRSVSWLGNVYGFAEYAVTFGDKRSIVVVGYNLDWYAVPD